MFQSRALNIKLSCDGRSKHPIRQKQPNSCIIGALARSAASTLCEVCGSGRCNTASQKVERRGERVARGAESHRIKSAKEVSLVAVASDALPARTEEENWA